MAVIHCKCGASRPSYPYNVRGSIYVEKCAVCTPMRLNEQPFGVAIPPKMDMVATRKYQSIRFNLVLRKI